MKKILILAALLTVSPATADHQDGEPATHCIRVEPTGNDYASRYTMTNTCSYKIDVVWCFDNFHEPEESCGKRASGIYYKWRSNIDPNHTMFYGLHDEGKNSVSNLKYSACRGSWDSEVYRGIVKSSLVEPTISCH